MGSLSIFAEVSRLGVEAVLVAEFDEAIDRCRKVYFLLQAKNSNSKQNSKQATSCCKLLHAYLRVASLCCSLQLPDATPQQIKKAYYNCMKACHPDLSGDDPDITNFCMFINEVYEVLSDPVQRMVYDEIHGYALSAINPFLDDSAPRDHAFVDEFSCIGCKNCANVAPEVFQIEEDFGRARVCNQSGNPALVQEAIDTCPVDCIHWTSAAQVSLLEDEMRRMERVNVGLMLAGMGVSADVFRTASSMWQKRQSKVLEKARVRMSKQKGSDKDDSWTDLWGKPKDYQNTEEEAKERSKRAAAAARRWREYSRKGADRPPTFKLPEALANKE